MRPQNYTLTAVPRPWVTEWLWRALCRTVRPLMHRQPLRWILTTPTAICRHNVYLTHPCEECRREHLSRLI